MQMWHKLFGDFKPFIRLPLRKRCPYSEIFWSAFSGTWTEYGEIRSISLYSVRMQENADQNDSEYGHFSRSVFIHLKLKLVSFLNPNSKDVEYIKLWIY